MATISVYLPGEIYEKYKNDKERRGLVAKLIADHYGMKIIKSRVVKK